MERTTIRTDRYIDVTDDASAPVAPYRVASSPLAVPRLRSLLALKAVLPANDLVALATAFVIVRHVSLIGDTYRYSNAVGVVFITGALLALNAGPRSRINPRVSEDIGWVLGRVGVPLLLVLPLVAAGDVPPVGIVKLGIAASVLVVIGRFVAYGSIRLARARGIIFEPTLIVGAGPVGVQVAQTLVSHPEFGLVPIGFLDSGDGSDLPLRILGEVGELDAVARTFDVRRIIVAFGATREPELVRVLRASDTLPAEVYLIPRFFELGVGPQGPETEDLWGIPLVLLNRSALRRTNRRMKRLFDVVGASLAMLLTLPLMITAAVAVRVSSTGPILFRQRRVGRRGEIFELLKFRTMRINGDSETQWSVVNDERVTRVGRFLRRTSLDELPQLINVLKGEMSLVGPRPERPHFAHRFASTVSRYDDRHRVPVGMTGWAQVHNLRGVGGSIPDRILLDNYYIEHWSLWRDIVILARTVRQVFSGGGR
jgi:exopolysaccharide biosynthesis polyprenyl glycosylphosphotransferase